MNPVYSLVLAFDPLPPDTAASCFAKLTAAVVEWVQAVYPGVPVPLDGSPQVPAPGDAFTAHRQVIDRESELLTIEWSRPTESGDARLVCSAELARTPVGVQGRAAVRAVPAGGGVVPAGVEPFRPWVVDRWCELAAARVVGGEAVPADVRRVSARFVAGMADDLLLSPTRTLPLVMLAPMPDDQPLVNPDVLQEAVFGLAHVVELVGKDATFELTRRVGKEWSCFHGAVRIYWPEPTLGDDFRRHPLFFPAAYPVGPETDARLPRDVLARLCSAAHARFAAAPLVQHARGKLEQSKQAAVQRQIADLTARAAEGHEWLALLESAWQDNRKLKDELELAQLTLAELRQERDDLREQWATVAPEMAAAEDAAVRAEAVTRRYRERVLRALKKPSEAVDLAAEEFADTLRFLPSARKSADDSPYQYPERVYKLFRALDEIGRAIRTRGQLGESLFDALQKHGFEYKPHISVTSEGKFGGEYTFEYAGQWRVFDHHVTLGSSHSPRECLSVHWIRDDAAGVFAVGWCGRHLTNTRT